MDTLNTIESTFELEPNSIRFKTIPKDTILYSGNADIHDDGLIPQDPFVYKGQTYQRSGQIVFFTNHEESAQGYARCFKKGQSWLNKFKSIDKLRLIDLNFKVNQEYMEVDEVAIVCISSFDSSVDGIFIKYNGIYEIALCKPKDKLKHVGSKKCIGNNKFLNWTI